MERLSGKELIEYLEDNYVEDGTIIRVYKIDYPLYAFQKTEDKIFDMVIEDGELNWKSGTFKASMLWDDDYYFEIVDDEPCITKWEDVAIEDMKTGKTLGHLKPYIETIMRTQNEIIDKLEELDER